MKRAFTFVEAIIVIAIILILAAILFPVFARRRGSHPSRCQSNLKQIGLGFLQYVQDWNEKFPPARVTSTIGWGDALQPYTKSRQLFECNAVPTSSAGFSSALTGFSSDYFYNRNLVRVSQTNIDSAAQTILSGDGADNAPTWNSISQLPPTWTATSNSPSLRHLEAAYYLFADGHVKSLQPSRIKPTLSSKDFAPTFAIRETP